MIITNNHRATVLAYKTRACRPSPLSLLLPFPKFCSLCPVTSRQPTTTIFLARIATSQNLPLADFYCPSLAFTAFSARSPQTSTMSTTVVSASASPVAVPSDHDDDQRHERDAAAGPCHPAVCPPPPLSFAGSYWDLKYGRIQRPRVPPHCLDLEPQKSSFKTSTAPPKGLSVRFADEARCVISGDVVAPRPPRPCRRRQRRRCTPSAPAADIVERLIRERDKDVARLMGQLEFVPVKEPPDLEVVEVVVSPW